MPSILVISLHGKSFFRDGKHNILLSTLLSRATVHESLTLSDAESYLSIGWPSIVLVTDPVLTQRRHSEFANNLVGWVHRGGTVILMGRFACDIEWPDLNSLLQLLHKDSVKPWAMMAYSKEKVKIHRGITGMRTHSLPDKIEIRALFLKNVRQHDTLYYHRTNMGRLCSTAYAQVGFGWLGFVGNMEYDENAQHIIISMCRLDKNKSLKERFYETASPLPLPVVASAVQNSSSDKEKDSGFM